MTIQNYVVRANKGKPRIWLEGKRLSASNFSAGDRFEIIHTRSAEQLVMLRKIDGGRKVSGKLGRPIIDLSGSSCLPFATGDAVTIEYSLNEITIKGNAA